MPVYEVTLEPTDGNPTFVPNDTRTEMAPARVPFGEGEPTAEGAPSPGGVRTIVRKYIVQARDEEHAKNRAITLEQNAYGRTTPGTVDEDTGEVYEGDPDYSHCYAVTGVELHDE